MANDAPRTAPAPHCLAPLAGREVVGQLLSSPRWAEVRTVGRRPVEVPAAYSTTADERKLKQVGRSRADAPAGDLVGA